MHLAERDTGLLGSNYLLDPAQAIGMQLKRNVSADTVLSYTQLENNRIVRRGDKVVISSGNSSGVGKNAGGSVGGTVPKGSRFACATPAQTA
ncbi:flagella basal body P-ring formation protein FlgA [Halopseudomonas pachastrellae]|nr:flagella basal body P-ring formation protein FlgA [Halopseudomonas pachastrellae]